MLTTQFKYPFPTNIAFNKARLLDEAERVRTLSLEQVEYSCTTDRGLRAMIYGSGRTVLYSRYSFRNRPWRIKLGELGLITLEQARQQHRAIRLKASQGEDPRAPESASLTFRDLHEQHYIVQCRSRNKKSLHTDISRYQNWLGPEFGSMRVADINKTHINRFVLKMRESGLAPATIKTTVGQLSTTLELSVELGVVTRNVAKGLRLPPANNRRTAFMTVPQVSAFIAAAEVNEQVVGSRMLKLMALTNARLGEAMAAEWNHIRLDEGIWDLPTQKSGQPGVIYLSEDAKAVICELATVRRNQFLFPGTRGNDRLRRPIRLFRRLCQEAGIPAGFRIHDLRHAWVSAGVVAGIPLEVLSQGARHSSPVITRIYSHIHKTSLVACQNTIANLYLPKKAA